MIVQSDRISVPVFAAPACTRLRMRTWREQGAGPLYTIHNALLNGCLDTAGLAWMRKKIDEKSIFLRLHHLHCKVMFVLLT